MKLNSQLAPLRAIHSAQPPSTILKLSTIALAMTLASQGWAQEEIEEIQITGTRIQREGMESPTPVTDLGLEELGSIDPGQLGESLSKLPQFFNNQRPSQVGWNSAGSNLNLRGAGSQRSLVLLDGRRVPAGNRWGIPNVSALPEAAIRSVQAVTGGASAAYGTDAVAGVINFVLDTDYNGTKVKAQAGTSYRADGDNTELGLTHGRDIGDKGHLLVSIDSFRQEEIRSQQALEDRSWYRQQARITNPDPSGPTLITRDYVVSTSVSPGGTINAPGSELNRWVFTRDDSGNVVAGPQSFSGVGQFIGGCNCQALTAATQDWQNDGDNQISARNDRDNVFVYYDHDVSDNLNVYAQGIYGYTEVESPWFSTPFLSGPWTVNIFSGNPFLPANVQQIMDDEGRASINMAMIGDNQADNPLGQYTLTQNDRSKSGTVGFNLRLDDAGFFTDWNVKGYAQYGRVDQRQQFFSGPDLAYLFPAMDAVVGPDGQPACYAAVVNPDQWGDCRPINLLGGVQSAASTPDGIDYVIDQEKFIESLYEQTFAEITIDGELHEGWGAGPILAFFGASHRKDEVLQQAPELEDEFVFLNGQNTGFRGLVPENFPGGMPGIRAGSVPAGFQGTSNLSRVLFTGSIQTPTTILDGSFTVDEVFGEINVPLVADKTFMQQLDASLAYRYADYSGSGGVESWKVGLSWQINDDLRVRATSSRDVRAATLRERFDETAGGAAVVDPFLGNSFIFTASRNAGNPSVDPEEADTLTFGAVYQPSWLPGFSISGDWYDIKIDGAMAQPPFQDIVDNCFAGAQELCDLIERSPETGQITRITTIYFNLDELRLKGFDLEMRYRTDISLFGGDESLSWRLIGSHIDERSQLIPGAPRDYLDRSDPTNRFLTNLTYTRGDFRAFLNGQYIDSWTQDRFSPPGEKDDNTIESVFITDLTLGYDFLGEGGNTYNIFLTVNNVFDEAPPLTPGDGVGFLGGTSGINGLYDAIGRRYVFGVNMSF